MSETEPDPNKPLRIVGRYAVYGKLATGGMATVHFGRLLGPVGFSRTVAIKRLHPQFAKDPEFVAMFLDEARLAARIQHPNVVATLDVVARGEELFLVMDYIRGESFSRLLRAARRRNIEPPEGIIGSVISGMLHGLHAAHEATDERGQALHVVHRDVSPQNVLVGTDGVARVLDFGVAKAAARIQITRDGQMKGKLSYMSPEQLSAQPIDRRSDVFAAGVVIWEALTGRRLFAGENATDVLKKILQEEIPPPSAVRPDIRKELDALVLKALSRDPDARYRTAREFAIATEEVMVTLSAREVGEWVEHIAGESLEKKEQALAEIEGVSSISSVSELAGGLTPSEPSFMRTWAGSSKTSPKLSEWQLRSQPPPKPVTTDDDAATTIYHSSSDAPVATPTPPPPLPGDKTLVYDMTQEGDATSPGAKRPQANPFRQPLFDDKRKVGAIALLVGMGIVFLLFFALSNADKKEPTASKEPKVAASSTPSSVPVTVAPTTQASAPAPPPTPVQEETTPSAELPEPEASKQVVEAREVKPRVKAPVKKRRPVVKPVPVKKDPCAEPTYYDSKGIRRVKPQCL